MRGIIKSGKLGKIINLKVFMENQKLLHSIRQIGEQTSHRWWRHY